MKNTSRKNKMKKPTPPTQLDFINLLRMADNDTKCSTTDYSDDKQLQKYLVLGDLYLKNRKIAEARRVFHKCIELYPHNFKAYYNMGILSTMLGENDAAKLFFEKSYDLVSAESVAQGQLVGEICGAIAALCVKLSTPHEALRWCNIGFIAVGEGETNRICLMNYNIAQRQVGNIIDALRLTWRHIDSQEYVFGHYNGINSVSNSCSLSSIIHINFAVVKWGTKYGPEYVNRLNRAIRTFMTSALEKTMTASTTCTYALYCITDDPSGLDDGVTSLPFPDECAGWKGWWLKAALFKPGNFPIAAPDDASASISSHVCYFDLDTILCTDKIFCDILSMLSSASIHRKSLMTLSPANMQNEARKVGINSSFMIWPNSSFAILFDYLAERYVQVTEWNYKFDHYMELIFYRFFGVECFVVDDETSFASLTYAQQYFPSVFIEYKQLLNCVSEAIEDVGQSAVDEKVSSCIDSYSVVCFPLKPKPHELQLDLIQLFENRVNNFLIKKWIGSM